MPLHVHALGDDGPPLLCLHGLTGHGRRFRALADGLPGRRVLAPDLRGHGLSTWEPSWSTEQHVADVLEIAPEGPVDLLGFSFGGRIAAALAAAHPERVSRLVLLDPALTVPPGLADEWARAVFDEVPFATAEEAVDAVLDSGRVFTTPRAVLEEDVAEHYETRPDGRLAPRVNPAVQVTSWSEMARPAPPVADVPTLVVTGARSWMPVDVGRLAPARHVEVPGGHSVLWDDLERTTEAVRGFLS